MKRKPKPMTLDRFFELLPRRGWRSYFSGEIRSFTRSGFEVCPVCRVANILAKKPRFLLNHHDAAQAIGLPQRLAERIAEAEDESEPIPLRRRLLKHCGLEEEARW